MESQIEMSTAENLQKHFSLTERNNTATREVFSFDCSNDFVGNSTNCWLPFNCLMVDYQCRMDTFTKWPKQMVQHPAQLVHSGFYYTGYGDKVTCFYCGTSISS